MCAPAIGCKDAHAGMPLDVVLPFVCVGVPVKLTHATGVDFHQHGRNHCRNWKYPGIGDPHGSALCLDRLLRQHLWLKLGCTGVAPAILSALSGPGTGAAKCIARSGLAYARKTRPPRQNSCPALRLAYA